MLRILLIYLLLVIPCFAADFHVDVDAATDSGVGTQVDPWKYIPGQASSTHTGDVSSGDTIYCQKGDTWTEYVSVIDGVTYDAYGTGDNPILDVSGITGSEGFYGSNIATCTIKNFRIIGSGGGRPVRFIGTSGVTSGYGIRFENCQMENDDETGSDNQHDCVSTDGIAEVWLEDCDLTKCKDPNPGGKHQAITAHSDSKIYMNGGTITDSSIVAQNTGTSHTILHNVTISGIIDDIVIAQEVDASTITLDGCDIDIDSGSSFIASSANGGPACAVFIKNSTIDVTNSALSFIRGITVILENNTFNINNADTNWESYGASVVLRSINNAWNITAANGGGVFETKVVGDTFSFTGDTFVLADMFLGVDTSGGDATFNFCVLKNSTDELILVDDNATGTVTINGMTVYNSPRVIDNNLTTGDTGEVVVNGSIFHTVTDPIQGNEQLTVSNNDYYNSADEGGVGSITSDPLFISTTDLCLSLNSPCLNTGTLELAGVYTDGFGYTNYYTADDVLNIGADQYDPSSQILQNPHKPLIENITNRVNN